MTLIGGAFFIALLCVFFGFSLLLIWAERQTMGEKASLPKADMHALLGGVRRRGVDRSGLRN